MALAAGDGNIAMIDRRPGIAGSQNLMRAAMTIHTGCGRRTTSLGRLGVGTVGISILRIRMALSAGDLLRRGLMGQALHVFMAIDATEQVAVDGMLQLVFIHV